MAKTLPPSPAKKQSKLKLGLLIGNAALLVVLAVTSGYFFRQYHNLQNDQKLTDEQRTQKRVDEVAKVYSLPGDEKPVFAIVSDEAKFREQYKVFDMGIKDDYLLLYQKAGLAVLYRPSDKKVIKTAQLTVKKEINVQMLGTTDQITAAEKTLAEKISSGLKVTNRDSPVSTYSAITVVDVAGTQGDAAKQIAEAIGGTVGTLPTGETAATGADIVIVLATPATP